ncbi:unnamed protein product [Chrysodeixis includens]|uniref:Uncharacterized protein n=1 Tax=Chrysodeixis includens TaxID=689277 RepID=A0A9N8Q032_CHRIL|nr:unnamed protein product [Chrysodeixis includens]
MPNWSLFSGVLDSSGARRGGGLVRGRLVKAAREQAACSQRQQRLPRARTMLLALACLFAAAAAAPARSGPSETYDQRQDGELNVRADVQNVVFLVAIPNKLPLDLVFDMFSKDNSGSKWDTDQDLQDRSDVHVMDAFVEPSTPYRVEIGAAERSAGDGRAAEVVIAGRRRLEADSQERDELKLLGATENCGPERMRDSETLMCIDRPAKAVDEVKPASDKDNKLETQKAPEVVPS